MKKGIWLDKGFENGPDFVQYEPETLSAEAERSEEAQVEKVAAEAPWDSKASVGKAV